MKKFLTFSGRMIFALQTCAILLFLVALPFVSFTASNLLVAVITLYAFSNIGVSLMLHRYWAHRSFEFKSATLKWIFTFITLISSRGSPLAWAHIHRDHHAHSDTENDPHRPGSFSFFSFKTTYIQKVNVFLIRDFMTKEHKFMHEYYLLFILVWLFALALINVQLVVFAWALPVVLNQVIQDLWNFFSHVNVGYRNHETDDNSRNVPFLWPFIFGEAWHNNHHKAPRATTKNKWWEFDPIGALITVIGK